MQRRVMRFSLFNSSFLLLLFAAALLGQTDLIHGTLTTTGTSDVKVVCDRWPDASDMGRFASDAIRLMQASTEEQKALAVWRFVRMFSSRTDGNSPREPALGDTYIDDPVKVLNVYGAHWCDGLSRVMEVAWRALGFRAEKLYRSGHTQADVFWRDQDGIGRWHLMDLSEGWYVYNRSGRHIATPDEIAGDFSLIHRPSAGPIPRKPHYWGMANYVHAPHLPWPEHRVGIGLRPNEKYTRLWGNLSLPYQDNYGAAGKTDFEHGPYPVTFGNGTLEYSPDFQSADYRNGLWQPPVNLKSVAEDGIQPNLHPSTASLPATAIFLVQSPYIISDARVSGSFYRRTSADAIALSVSTDLGKSWKTAWQASQTGNFVLENFGIAEKFNIYKAVPAGLISPFGRYRYLLKLEIAASANIADVGVNSLTITTITQHNVFSLPQLWPGENRITVSGSVLPDTSLRITYSWQDLLGIDRKSVALVENTPYTYVINTAGEKWEDVINKEIRIEAVPRAGGGNRVLLREQQPRRLVNVTPAQAFPTQRIVGTAKPAALKTVGEYIADLSHAKNQVKALNGLILLKDKRALDAVRKVAFESIAFPNKDLAIQALYRIGGADSIPVLLEIVKKNPAVRWKYDAGNKFVELGHWYHTAAMTGHLLADAGVTAAAPLLAAVLDNIIANDDRSWEPHAGIIRALGRLGVRETAPSIRPFLNRQEDVSSMAIWALGELRDDISAAAIRKIFSKTSYPVQKMRAAEALSKLNDQESVQDLCRLLTSKDENLRAAAAEGLGRLGNKTAIPFLQEAIARETFPWVKDIAEASIKELNKPLGSL